MTIRIGTRGSDLALWQAQWVAKQLQLNNFTTDIIIIETKGDRMLDVSMSKIGSKGVFTQELEEKLLAGNIDLAVHSAKDLPSEIPVAFELIAFGERAQPGDVLVAKDHLNLEKKLTIGTSSTRRVALVKHYYPQAEIVPIRGNVPTRIKKMQDGACDGLVLAHAGIQRLGLDQLIQHRFPLDQFVPAVAQGSVAIEASNELDTNVKGNIRKAINHRETEYCLLAERSFLKVLQGGCSIPAFAFCQINHQRLSICGGIIDLDGEKMIKEVFDDQKENAVYLGETLAHAVLDNGGAELLDRIKQQL